MQKLELVRRTAKAPTQGKSSGAGTRKNIDERHELCHVHH
jgi:hypothetical protein